MTAQAVSRARTFPFHEHRTLAEVKETESLQRAYGLRTIKPSSCKRLQELQSRAVNPLPPAATIIAGRASSRKDIEGRLN